jgi:hypothetical protein
MNTEYDLAGVIAAAILLPISWILCAVWFAGFGAVAAGRWLGRLAARTGSATPGVSA